MTKLIVDKSYLSFFSSEIDDNNTIHMLNSSKHRSLQVIGVELLRKSMVNINFTTQEDYYLVITSQFALHSFLQQVSDLEFCRGFLLVGEQAKKLIAPQISQHHLVIQADNLASLALNYVQGIADNSINQQIKLIRLGGNFSLDLKQEFIFAGLEQLPKIEYVTSYQNDLLYPTIDEFDAVVLTSPTMFKSFARHNHNPRAVAFCLGNTTANAISPQAFKKIVIADKPNLHNLRQTIINYYQYESHS